jgi:hypothetical protein
MSVRHATGWIPIALGMLIVTVGSAVMAEVPIDDFSQADKTGMLLLLNNASSAMPSTTATDSGLSGVIGGVRQLTVSADGPIPVGQEVCAKVDTAVNPDLTPGLSSNSSFNGRGTFDLLYDAGGVGLDVDLSQFKGIRFRPNVVDAGVGGSPVMYKLTLVDESSNTASATVSSAQSCFQPDPQTPCDEHRFLFSDFSGISLRHIRSIMLSIASDNAFDAIIGPITLFGSTETAPLLSAGMIAMLVAMLGVVGLIGMRRPLRAR